jgi:single-stranded-DNA-specific exonuclease
MKVIEKKFSPSQALTLIKSGVHPVLSRVLAARGVRAKEDAALTLPALLPYTALKGAVEMAKILADAIENGKRLLIVADYDADGATACTTGVRALRAFGANVGFLIPNRLEHGYGLTPAIVEIACALEPRPDYLVTVDNGISSHEGIALSNSLGVPVLVTDHHLPGATHPDAEVIVNPNQHGCTFPSKALAGCGVMYYVMWALQDELMSRGYENIAPGFDVTTLLPIIAIGTVADVVSLDTNNRILVNEGIKRIRENKGQPGVRALAKVSGKDTKVLSTSDIAFGIGPRVNAAGRLESMDSGVECLITDSEDRAHELAAQLHAINDRRKEIELDMTDEAVRRLITDLQPDRYSAVLHSAEWHQGVIGVVAGRIKEKIWRPTFVLADGKNGEMKGSGRSIPGLHLRDALDLVNTRNPGVLSKFGGHAMAAGVTVCAGKLSEFTEAFEQVSRELINPSDLNQILEVDGSLSAAELNLETVRCLKEQVWGQSFTEPVFFDEFSIVEARPIGGGLHLRMLLEKNGCRYQAVKFRYSEAPPVGKVLLAYKIDGNTYKDETNLQLLVEHIIQ